MQQSDIDNRFAYHAPDGGAVVKHESVRSVCAYVATAFEEIGIPDSREKSLALTHLEEAMFWANAAIARIDENGDRR